MLVLAATALATALVVVTAAFGTALLRGRYDTIDSVWGLGFAAIAIVTFSLGNSAGTRVPAVVITALTVIWGVRLSLHIFLRSRAKPEDPRYQAILDRAARRPKLRMFLRVYLVQALVMWFVSLPVQTAQLNLGDLPALNALLWVGIALWVVGMVFESVGDEQLRRFRDNPDNAGAVLDRGLWRYTRHPNYFGDACVWWGLYLVACYQIAGVATVLSPVLMTWLLAAGSGKPIVEKHLRQNRPAYADYLERTSGFLPLPPKSGRRSHR